MEHVRSRDCLRIFFLDRRSEADNVSLLALYVHHIYVPRRLQLKIIMSGAGRKKKWAKGTMRQSEEINFALCVTLDVAVVGR